MSKLELERFILNNNKDNLNWDKQINTDIELKDISEEKLLAFTKSANLTFTNKQDVLKKLDLMKNNQLTNASILLFGKNPKDFFPLLNLRCASFTGVDKASNPIDMTDFQGDLFELIQKAETYVLEHINVGMKIEGLKRVNLPEINKDAFREAIINAFCHRDYSIPQEIQIAIFKDRVEILNPGKLYAGLSIKEILSKSISERRNPLIADIFHKVDFVEKWGTGIKRIRQLEPKTTFEEINRFFQVTFKRNPAPYEPKKNAVEKFTITKAQLRDKHIPKQVLLDWLGESWEKVGRSLGVNALKVLIVLYTKPEKTISELAVELDLSTTAIENNLKKLKDAKVLKRIGSDKEGYWEILPPNN